MRDPHVEACEGGQVRTEEVRREESLNWPGVQPCSQELTVGSAGEGRKLAVAGTSFSWAEQRLGGPSYRSEQCELWMSPETWART